MTTPTNNQSSNENELRCHLCGSIGAHYCSGKQSNSFGSSSTKTTERDNLNYIQLRDKYESDRMEYQKRIKELEARIHTTAHSHVHEENDILKSSLSQCVEALEFYSNEQNWKVSCAIGSDGVATEFPNSPIDQDYGDKANKALTSAKSILSGTPSSSQYVKKELLEDIEKMTYIYDPDEDGSKPMAVQLTIMQSTIIMIREKAIKALTKIRETKV